MAGGRTFLIKLFADSKNAEDGFKKVADVAGGFNKKMLLVGGAVAGVFTAIIGGSIKAGKALLDLGQEFDDAFDKIRIGTGATGAAFESLQESFRTVAAAGPASFADVSTAITNLATRTNLTGEQLETMSERTLTLSRLLEEDLSGVITSTTKVFNRYNLTFPEQLEYLDLMLRASQATGASVTGLSDSLLTAKPALDRLGLSLEEQVALLGSFEREGVPAERIVQAITRGVARFAEEGQPAAAALRAVFDEIRAAPSADEADAIGQRIFGARGFAPVVDAIRDGALEIDTILRTLRDGDTIMGLAEETDGLRERWAEFKNFLKLQFEPAANEVFTAAEGLIAKLQPAVTRVIDAFERDGLEGALRQVAVEWNKIYNDPEIGLKALWEKFLKFMREYVLPQVIELGKVLGRAIFDGIVEGFNDALRNLAKSPLGRSISIGASLIAPSLAGPAVRSLFPTASTPTSSISGSGGGVTRLAEGGIVTRPTFPALIGEAGPEAVIPLDRLGSMGTTINLTVNGALDAEGTARTIIRVLEDAQRRSGVRLAV